MAIVDIVILLALVGFVVVGIVRGFANSLISLCGWFVSLIISIFLARPFAALLENIFSFDNWIGQPILAWLSQKEILNTAIPTTESGIRDALNGAGLPNFLTNILTPALDGIKAPVEAESFTLAEIIAPAITHCVVLVISFIVLHIIVRIIVVLLQHLVERTVQHFAFINAVDKTLGGVFGFVKFVFVVFVAIMILTPFKTYDFMDWYEKDIDKSTIGKFVEDNNFLASWLFGGIKNYIGGEEPKTDEPEETEGEEQTSYLLPDENTCLYKIISNKTDLLGFDYINLKNLKLE